MALVKRTRSNLTATSTITESWKRASTCRDISTGKSGQLLVGTQMLGGRKDDLFEGETEHQQSCL